LGKSYNIGMISYLEGKIVFKKDKYAVLNVGGVGYKVIFSHSGLSKLPEPGGDLKTFCYLNVRETAIDLYGFLSEKELELFELLQNIRGVGPKTALLLSSLGSVENIKEKIMAKDDSLFSGIQGIGRKKAMAIMLELTGKIKDISAGQGEDSGQIDEAEEGLVALNFSRQKAKSALLRIPKDIKETEQRIKEALKII
jgi:holliday junction DNA helicase RuvA